MARNRGPRIEVQPLGENLAATIEQAKGSNPITSKPTDTTLDESIPGVSIALRSSRSIPSATLVSLAMVQKLKAQMATLLHHIQPWM